MLYEQGYTRKSHLKEVTAADLESRLPDVPLRLLRNMAAAGFLKQETPALELVQQLQQLQQLAAQQQQMAAKQQKMHNGLSVALRAPYQAHAGEFNE
jgi:hypothetical protein